MADTGFLHAGGGSEDSSFGSKAWSNISNLTADDNSYANGNTGGGAGGETYYLKGTNYGASVPGGATIDGIEIRIKCYCVGDFMGSVTFARVRVVKAGTISTTELSSSEVVTGSETAFTFGGSTNLCGESWTVSDINDTTTGVVVSFTYPDFMDATAYVDSIEIKVHYTPGGGGGSSNSSAAVGGCFRLFIEKYPLRTGRFQLVRTYGNDPIRRPLHSRGELLLRDLAEVRRQGPRLRGQHIQDVRQRDNSRHCGNGNHWPRWSPRKRVQSFARSLVT